jgi:hypothetical protein
MNKLLTTSYSTNRPAFSLIETITVVVISALVLITTINIYTRVRAAADSVENVIVDNEMPNEILQRLAEDIDKLAVPGFDTTIRIEHRFDSGYDTCRMIITNDIYDSKNKKQIYEEIVWQTAVDPDDGILNLYRLHTGFNTERKIAYDYETQLEPEPKGGVFVTMAIGLTHFTIEVIKDKQKEYQETEFLNRWISTTLPKALYATVSFAMPEENEFGEAGIPLDKLISRTIAVDRTRNIPFEFVAKDFSSYDNDDIDKSTDPNQTGSDL